MKYEYKILPQLHTLEQEMNALGEDGWELVCFNSDIFYYVFKRVIK